MMYSQGYAMPQQTVAGVHTRLWARAFIVADPTDIRCADHLAASAYNLLRKQGPCPRQFFL